MIAKKNWKLAYRLRRIEASPHHTPRVREQLLRQHFPEYLKAVGSNDSLIRLAMKSVEDRKYAKLHTRQASDTDGLVWALHERWPVRTSKLSGAIIGPLLLVRHK